MSPRAGVRIAIVGIFAVLATVFYVEDARSQPGRPGVPRPGGITGVPRPGVPGGITGIGGIPQPPSFPAPPSFPTPPNFGPPKIPRGPQFETVWSCGKCKAELGRGNVKPSYDSCPQCGVRFINGGGGGNGGFGLINPPPPPDLGAPSLPPAAGGAAPDPDLMPRGNGGGANTEAPSFTAPPQSPNDAKPAPPEEKTTSKTGSLILKIMIGVFALLFLIGIAGGAFLIFSANKGSKPAKKSRRRAREDDDEDDD